MIFNPSIHVSKMSHPKSVDHKRFFVYKQGKCYLGGACISQLRTFATQRRDSLDISKEVVILETNVISTLLDAGFSIEKISASYDKLVQEFTEDKEKCQQRYKDDLYKWLGIMDLRKDTFDKFYNLARLLSESERFEFGYEEYRSANLAEDFELNLRELVDIGLALVKDLKQK